MAKPRPEKKREPEPSAEQRVLPMPLTLGDRFSEDAGCGK
jgi:hypothetical protein